VKKSAFRHHPIIDILGGEYAIAAGVFQEHSVCAGRRNDDTVGGSGPVRSPDIQGHVMLLELAHDDIAETVVADQAHEGNPLSESFHGQTRIGDNAAQRNIQSFGLDELARAEQLCERDRGAGTGEPRREIYAEIAGYDGIILE
jgi:hypothetical protein